MDRDVEYKCKQVQVSVDGTFKVPRDAVILGVYVHKIAVPIPPDQIKKGGPTQNLAEVKIIHYAVPMPFMPSLPLRGEGPSKKKKE